MRHLLDVTDFSVEELNALINRALDIIDNREKYAKVLDGKKLATLFFEPSTRTRLSFEAAMIELGGSVIGFSSASSSSATKGECLKDTIRVVSRYADVIAMRHPIEGTAIVASQVTSSPIINAGDGGHAHPTQTLADILTIKRTFNRLDNLTIGFCGDLKYGRTVHSLINAMIRYEGIRFVLISPKELSLPIEMKEELKEKNIPFIETEDMEEYMSTLDVLYMTRVQEERFDNRDDFLRHKDCYILSLDKMSTAKKDVIVMHPLPRVNEIAFDVDDDKRAVYFDQVENGKYMRMALILTLLEKKGEEMQPVKEDECDLKCQNPKCVTNNERGQAQSFVKTKRGYKCNYCEKEIIL